jgi:catechol 2,3-dioxygenase-like lactoylglutathione lyase family enzyme
MRTSKLIASLGVSDIERSLGFYRGFFGFEPVDSYAAEDGRVAWYWLRSDGAELMLQQLTADQQIRLNPAIGQSWVMYVRVKDIDAVHASLRQADFPASDIGETAYGTREFFVSDPDGYELWISVPLAEDDEPPEA